MAPRIPPLGTDFLKITYDREDRIVGMVMSPEWQKYFAQSQQFQEAVGVALNLSDIQDALDTTRESLESTLETDVQAIIDAGAAIQFGADYQGKWEAGAYAVGEVVYYSGYFYECDVARIASHTDNPATDTTGWSLRVYEVMLTGDVNVDLSSLENSIQNAIDAQGTAAFGEDYQGVWGGWRLFRRERGLPRRGILHLLHNPGCLKHGRSRCGYFELVDSGFRVWGLGCGGPGGHRRLGNDSVWGILHWGMGTRGSCGWRYRLLLFRLPGREIL